MSLRWVPDGPDAARVEDADGASLARYRFGRDKNHPFFHDLRPRNHAGIVTNHAPWDHRWHHGLWWSWKFVNDVLFWEDHPDFGGARGRGLGRSVVTDHRVEQTDGVIVVAEALDWTADETGRTLLRESRRMTLTVVPELAGAWSIAWDLTWTATEPVTLSTTSYPEHWWGGYAGLNYRAARAMADGERIVASGGRCGRDAVHAEPARWAALTGRVDGAGTDTPDRPAVGGLALVERPGNPGSPNPVYAFSAAAEFGFLAYAPAMHRDLTIDEGAQLRLRFDSVVLGDAPAPEQLDALAEEGRP